MSGEMCYQDGKSNFHLMMCKYMKYLNEIFNQVCLQSEPQNVHLIPNTQQPTLFSVDIIFKLARSNG